MTSDRLVLGTAKLGIDGDATAFALLDEFVRLGGRMIDTASVYHLWRPGIRSEEIIGEWLAARGNRDQLTIATKGAHPPLGQMDRPRRDAASIRGDVELSLKRLGVAQIDMWSLHRDDPSRPAAEIIGVLQALQREGMIARFGASNWTVERLDEALAGPGAGLASTQVLGNVFCRIMNPLADTTSVVLDPFAFRQALTHKLSLLLYTSTAHGFFERRAKGMAPTADYTNAACERAAAELEAIARELGIAPANLALASMLEIASPACVVIGPRNAEQLREIWRGGEIALPPGTAERIATIVGMSGFAVG